MPEGEKLDRTKVSRKSRANNILEGFRVIDFTAFMSGPYSTRWLADLGAEVIKIEPIGGEWMRTMEPQRDGKSMFYGQMNAGKRSIALNLRDPDGVRIARDLCLAADIVVENFRPGVMKRFGLDADTLRAAKPELIYCSISGFGQKTSIANWPAYASIVHASSGMEKAMADYRAGGDGVPSNCGLHFGDMFASLFATLSVQLAIVDRLRSGRGSTIDINLMDGIMNLLVYELQDAQRPEQEIPSLGRVVRAADGYLTVSPHHEQHVKALLACIGRPELADDPRLQTERLWNNEPLLQEIEVWSTQHTAEHCEQVFMSAGVPCARYRNVKEAMTDMQFVERDSFATVEDEAGKFKVANLPFSFDGEKPQAKERVHAVSEDARSILTRIVGLEPDELERLAAKGVLALGNEAQTSRPV